MTSSDFTIAMNGCPLYPCRNAYFMPLVDYCAKNKIQNICDV